MRALWAIFAASGLYLAGSLMSQARASTFSTGSGGGGLPTFPDLGALLPGGLGGTDAPAGDPEIEAMANPGNAEVEPQAGAVDWSAVRYFGPHEFRHLDHIDPRVIYAADQLRERLGRPLAVSPHPKATARFSGNPDSRHYAVDRKADALDLLVPEDVPLANVYDAARAVPSIGGVGLYPHWTPRHGVHIDTRPRGAGGGVAKWAGVRNAEGKQVLVGISEVLA